MKIAYIADLYAYRDSGVLNKINQTVKVWRELGHDAQAFLVSPPPMGNDILRLEVGEVIKSSMFNLVPPRFRYRLKYLNKIVAAHKLGEAIKIFAPDIIYFRQTVWFPGLLKALLKGDSPIVIEINTHEVYEYRLRGFFERFLHLNTRQWVFRRAAGLVAVTNEIAQSLQDTNLPVEVIGNGYDARSIVPRMVPDNLRPQILFVGSPGQPWHGVDRVAELARLLTEMDFHLVGSSLETRLPNLINHGYMNHGDLEKLYEKMDVGLGSLALHLNKMREGSPLKVREYLAYGLPVVIGYRDLDLQGCPFALEIEDVIADAEKIRSFIYNWKDRSVDANEVLRRIDCYSKEKQRIEFLSKFLEYPQA